MESIAPMPPCHHPDALEFVRFCRGRRPVPWPEIYDEMWAVADGRIFRGYDFEDLEERGIGFGLAAMPRLAALAQVVIAEEPRSARPLRRPVSAVRRGLAIVPGVAHQPGGPGASPQGR
jgi:hypothetical protein